MWRQTTTILMLLLAAASVARAEDAPAVDTLEATPADAAASPHAERIAELIRQLDSPRFAERQEASSALAGLGGEAIPALEAAIAGGSREVSTRALELLEGFFRDGSMETQAAAAAALGRVAAGDDAIAANRASEALAEASQAEANSNTIAGGGVPRLVPMPVQIGPGQAVPVPAVPVPAGNVQGIRIVPAARIGVQRVIGRQQGNGTTEITVTENGRTVKIREDQNGVRVEVTEPDEQGNDQTEVYQAGSVDELKRQHPEAGKLYEQYGQILQGGGIRVQAQAVPAGAVPVVPGPVVPGVPPAVPVPGPVPPQGAMPPQGVVPGLDPNQIQPAQAPADVEALKQQAAQLEEIMQFMRELQGELEVAPEGQILPADAAPAVPPVDPAGPDADDSGSAE